MINYGKLEAIEWRQARQNRWKKVFDKKPDYVRKLYDSISPLGKTWAWFSQGHTAAAYWASRDYLIDNQKVSNQEGFLERELKHSL